MKIRFIPMTILFLIMCNLNAMSDLSLMDIDDVPEFLSIITKILYKEPTKVEPMFSGRHYHYKILHFNNYVDRLLFHYLMYAIIENSKEEGFKKLEIINCTHSTEGSIKFKSYNYSEDDNEVFPSSDTLKNKIINIIEHLKQGWSLSNFAILGKCSGLIFEKMNPNDYIIITNKRFKGETNIIYLLAQKLKLESGEFPINILCHDTYFLNHKKEKTWDMYDLGNKIFVCIKKEFFEEFLKKFKFEISKN